jgi:hypothetical protein
MLGLRKRRFDAIRAHPAFKPTYYFGSWLTDCLDHLKRKAR